MENEIGVEDHDSGRIEGILFLFLKEPELYCKEVKNFDEPEKRPNLAPG